ncbi:hypothetical protein BCR33DRAFT_721991, partial [Rhizoclosmatium globosum]
MPLVWYKWKLAYDDETLLAEQSFNGIAQNLVQAVSSAWPFIMLGTIVSANSVVGLDGTLQQSYYDRLTDESQYFSFFGTNSQVGMFLRVEAGEQETQIKNYFLNLVGPNLGSNSTFNFFGQYANGTRFLSQNQPFYYVTYYRSKANIPAARGTFGFNAWSDTL